MISPLSGDECSDAFPAEPFEEELWAAPAELALGLEDRDWVEPILPGSGL